MMKILHTSDWHLGQTLYDYDRTEEHRHFLRQLIDIVKEHQPDALLICGDVFDRINPTNEARNMYIDTLLAIHDQNPYTTIVVTAGNHDNKSSLNMEGRVWDRLKVKVIGQVERNEDGSVNFDRHIIKVKGQNGEIKGLVVAVPHIFEQNYPQLKEDAPKEERVHQFYAALLEKAQSQNADRHPVVMMAHLAVTGSNFAGHDFQDMIGQLATVDQQWLGYGYDYLALGHIHGPQTLTGSCLRTGHDGSPMMKESFLSPSMLCRSSLPKESLENGGALYPSVARYCGSPIPVSFDEPGVHGVSLVTIEHGEMPVIEHLPIENIKPMLTIPQQAMPFEEAVAELRQVDADLPAYIRLNVLDNAPLLPNYHEAIDLALNGKKARYCLIKRTAVRSVDGSRRDTESIAFDPDSLPDPLALAKLFYQEQYGEMPAELKERLEEAVKRMTGGETN